VNLKKDEVILVSSGAVAGGYTKLKLDGTMIANNKRSQRLVSQSYSENIIKSFANTTLLSHRF
jgi:hypothetical protein